MGDLAELAIERREQLIDCLPISLAGTLEQLCNLWHRIP